MDNAMITIRTVHRDGYDQNETEIITSGNFSKLQNGYEIDYDDTDATGYVGARTTLKILNGHRIEMLRSGDFISELFIESGKVNDSIYGTPFGEMFVTVQTGSVESKLTDLGGNVTADYSLEINSNFVGEFELSIDVKCARGEYKVPIASRDKMTLPEASKIAAAEVKSILN